MSSNDKLQEKIEQDLDDQIKKLNGDASNQEVERDSDEDANDDDMPPLEDITLKESAKKNIVLGNETKDGDVDDEGWMDILDNGELKKKTLKSGDDNKLRAQRGQRVFVNVEVRVKDSQTVVKSESHDDFEVIVGDNDIVQGLDLAIPLMYEGEEAQVIISSRFGFGKLGKGEEVPPDAYLECLVHLLKIEEDQEELATDIPIDRRIAIGIRKKERGNFYFSRNDYSTAVQCYRSALNYLDANEGELENARGPMREKSDDNITEIKDDPDSKRVEQIVELRAATFNNMAASQMKIDALEAALKSVDSSLELQPENVKALFRKGKILAMKGEVQQAIAVLKRAQQIDSDSKVISQELSKLVVRKKQDLEKEKKLYKKMLQLDKPKDDGKSTNKKWMKWVFLGGSFAVAVTAVAGTAAYRYGLIDGLVSH